MTLVTARVQRRTSMEQGHVINVPKLGAVDLAPLRCREGLHNTSRAVRGDVSIRVKQERIHSANIDLEVRTYSATFLRFSVFNVRHSRRMRGLFVNLLMEPFFPLQAPFPVPFLALHRTEPADPMQPLSSRRISGSASFSAPLVELARAADEKSNSCQAARSRRDRLMKQVMVMVDDREIPIFPLCRTKCVELMSIGHRMKLAHLVSFDIHHHSQRKCLGTRDYYATHSISLDELSRQLLTISTTPRQSEPSRCWYSTVSVTRITFPTLQGFIERKCMIVRKPSDDFIGESPLTSEPFSSRTAPLTLLTFHSHVARKRPLASVVDSSRSKPRRYIQSISVSTRLTWCSSCPVRLDSAT
jgi:hypothetical protein